MAHMARAAGTDYAVAGGKTLIGGTAYSVVATREVEKTVVVSGFFPNTNYLRVHTINDPVFDWSKYKLKTLIVTGGKTLQSTETSSDCVLGFVYDDYGSSKFGWRMWGTPSRIILNVDTTVNGKLTIGKFGGDGVLTNAFYFALLEAKT